MPQSVAETEMPVQFAGPTFSPGIYIITCTAGSLTYGPENATPGQLEANIVSGAPLFIPANKYFFHQGAAAQVAGVHLGDEFSDE